jgi:murein DD-endopeptidase MepM/ murein hydrolase activator NlpD
MKASSAPSGPSFLVVRHVFPIAGRHTYNLRQGRFGTGRAGHTHQGQDVFAACGTPLVAVTGGTVKMNAVEGNAGNYVVLAGDDGVDYAYMHLRERSPLKKGATVTAGQPLGAVGDTGDAVGCHLHFEIWPAPGWYSGGAPIDPLPALRAWDS